MNKHFKYSVAGVFAGAIQVTAGILLTIFVEATILSWALIAIGWIAFIGSLLGATANRQAKKNAEGSQQLKNMLNDEREAIINDKAKAFAHDFLHWLLWVAIIALAVMQVELWIPLMLVGVQLVRMVATIAVSFWLRKNM